MKSIKLLSFVTVAPDLVPWASFSWTWATSQDLQAMGKSPELSVLFALNCGERLSGPH